MSYRKLFTFVLCLAFLVMTSSAAFARDVNRNDLNGINPQNYKYAFSVGGGFLAGLGLGYILPGSKTPLKLGLIGSGATNAWYLHTHRYALGEFHDWAMIGGNTVLGTGVGWLGCNCHDGIMAGALLGAGATAAWEALKNDRPAQNAFNRVRKQ